MKAILPVNTQAVIIQKVKYKNTIVGTTIGLRKTINEDRIAISHTKTDGIRIVMTDGHWGDQAADIATEYWLNATTLPNSRISAISTTEILESLLHDQFGQATMDPDIYKSPETSFIVCELKETIVKIIGYGDCRLVIARNGKQIFQYTTVATWLGAFSHVGLRGRESVKKALFYDTLSVSQGDVIYIYSDGVDECIYEVPTISTERIISHSKGGTASEMQFDAIMDEVFTYGAEDNASLGIIEIE